MSIQIKRVYDPEETSDGKRILVDRLWPRGVSKERADLDGWFKGLSPSTELREWFGHVDEKFDEFKHRYIKELDQNPEAQKEIQELLDMSKVGMVTLLYGARNRKHNEAVVLKTYLDTKEKALAE